MFTNGRSRKFARTLEDLVEAAKTSAKVTWTCGEHDFLQIFKEVKSELGALDLRLSMLRSAITTCIDLLMKENEGKQDQKLREKVETDHIEKTDANISLGCMTALAPLGVESKNSEIISSSRNRVDEEVEKLLSLKLKENHKLRIICNTSGQHRELVKERLKETILVSVHGDGSSQQNITR